MLSKSDSSKKDVVFTEQAKELVRKPLGKLIAGPTDKVIRTIISFLNREKFKKVIVVGDFSARIFFERSLLADIFIIDGKIERRRVNKLVVPRAKKISLTNPAGRISFGAFKAISKAIRLKGQVLIEVAGEEDLLTLVAIMEAPMNSLVVYGQPRKGMVAVKVTEQKKRITKRFLSSLQG